MNTLSTTMQIKIAQTHDMGRGVFATQNLQPGDLIELAPIIKLPKSQETALKVTELYNYYFAWGEKGDIAIGLGYISLYNHSYEPNARYEKDIINGLIAIYAQKSITLNEEITINYNGDPTDLTPLWFETLRM